MSDIKFNKYRAAADVLQRGREALVDTLAEEVLGQADDLLESGYSFNEFIESQGTRLHFLGLLVAHLEQSAEELDEIRATAAAQSAAQEEIHETACLEEAAAQTAATASQGTRA